MFRKLKVINVTSLSEFDEATLALFLSTRDDQQSFIKNVEYQTSATTNLSRLKLTLTHSLEKIIREKNTYYEVIGDEDLNNEFIYKYEVIGYLKFIGDKWKFEKSQSTLSLRFKSEVDVTTMGEEQGRLVGGVLLKIYHHQALQMRCYYPKSGTYKLLDEMKKILFIHLNLKFSLVAREREHYPGQIRFEVIGKRIGSGTFSQVYLSQMTLIPLSDGGLSKRFSNRIIKRQLHKPNAKNCGQKEYECGLLTDYLHQKKPVYAKTFTHTVSFLTSRFIVGDNLKKLIEKDKTVWTKFTMRAKFRLIQNLIRTLDEQVHQSKIVHRDVKPANIIVDDTSCDYPLVTYIDLGLSKHANVDDPGMLCGTPNYMAPELWDALSLTSAADVFALGMIIAEIFHIRKKNERPLPAENILALRLQRLYSHSCELTPIECAAIANIITNMVEYNIAQRYSLTQAFTAFDNVRLGYLVKEYLLNERIDFLRANGSARRLRLQLFSYFQTESSAINWAYLELAIRNSLAEFPDLSFLLEEFTFFLNEQLFLGLTTRSEVCAKIQWLADSSLKFSIELYVACQNLEDLLSHPDFRNLNSEYRHFLHTMVTGVRAHIKKQACPSSLDNALELVQQAETDICRVNIEIKNLEYLASEGMLLTPVVRPLVAGSQVNSMSHLFAHPASLAENAADVVAQTERTRSIFGRK